MAGTIEGQGLIARVTTALRYAVTGQSPAGWFGPLDPLPPQAPEDVRGRAWDYPIGGNINFRPRATEPLGFEKLRNLARNPIVAMLIQRQRAKVAAMDWQIKPRKGQDPSLSDDPAIKELTAFFAFPDKEHDWCQWIGAILDELMVTDAVTVYRAPTRAGGIYALQALDGSTIKPIISYGGRRPLAPAPAYQQVLKGLPAIDYTADELVYFPENYRTGKLYGYSRLEQACDLVEMSISRLRSQKGYFDVGNIGDGYFTAPTGWTPDQILALEGKWNQMMAPGPEVRRNAPMLPEGTEWHPTKVDVLSDQFDEFLIRLLCFPFGVAPQPFLKQTGLGSSSADTEHEAAEEGGVAPLMGYVERLMSLILAKWFGRPDLEFAYVDDREFDPKAAAEIDDMQLKNRSKSINEIRDRRGEPPVPWGDEPLVDGAGGVMPLSLAIERGSKEPEPVPASLSPAPVVGEPTAAGEDQGASEDDANSIRDKSLAKAADVALVQRLVIMLGAYLEAKAGEVADALTGTLVKAAMDDEGWRRIDDALDAVEWDWSDLVPVVEPIIAGITVAAGDEAVSELGLFDPETLKRVSANATAYAQERAAEMVGMKVIDGQLVPNPNPVWSIPDATRAMLRTAVAKAMEEGQSNDQLRRTIQEDYGFSKERASTIARTETAQADVRGDAIGWIESGIVPGARFDAAPECCPTCHDQNGKIVKLTTPNDIGLPHPNCRCSWSAVLEDEMPDT